MRRTLTSIAMLAAVAGAFWLGRTRTAAAAQAPGERPKWAAFRLPDIAERRARANDPWLEFFKTSTLRTGLYVLPAGGKDDQTPHAQDEVYHILRGRAVLKVDGEDLPVEPGSVVYVRAGIDHRFHAIAEELEVLVFFAS
jgi:mannose-6-phosphate isomerase-like protein (cupin superfamily)